MVNFKEYDDIDVSDENINIREEKKVEKIEQPKKSVSIRKRTKTTIYRGLDKKQVADKIIEILQNPENIPMDWLRAHLLDFQAWKETSK